MAYSEPMDPVDTTWLRLDRPANRTVIVGLAILAGPVDVDRLERTLAERLLVYRRFRQRVEFGVTGPWWCDDPDFDIAHHIKRIRLPVPGGARNSNGSSRTSLPSRSIPAARSGNITSSRITEVASPWSTDCIIASRMAWH